MCCPSVNNEQLNSNYKITKMCPMIYQYVGLGNI